MIEVIRQVDGLYAVRDVGGPALNDMLGLFTTEREAEEWLLDRNLRTDLKHDGLRLMLPGNGQGLS